MTHLLDIIALCVVWVALCVLSALVTWAAIEAPIILGGIVAFFVFKALVERFFERNLLND